MSDINGSITVPVNPITKTSWISTGRGRGHWGSKTYTNFRNEVVGPMEDACEDLPMLWQPLRVGLEIFARRPKTSKYPFPVGDIDNFQKAVFDAATERLWIDDWQICDLLPTRKRWADPEGELPGGYFVLSWEVADEYADWPVFSERKLQWEMCQ